MKLDSIYIDNTQIQRPIDLKPVAFQRSISMRTPGRANMVMKSDAYDDGRAHMYRDGLGKDKKILQNANARRSLRECMKKSIQIINTMCIYFMQYIYPKHMYIYADSASKVFSYTL